MRYILAIAALAAITACDTAPNSSNSGVGFGNYDQYQKDQAQRKAAQQRAVLPPPEAVSDEALTPVQTTVEAQPVPQPQPTPESDLAAATQSVLSTTPQTTEPVKTTTAEPVNTSNVGISDENDFDAVGERRTIESDAARIEQNKEQYAVVETEALPKRSGSTGPNIVEYALRSKHPMGTQIYTRVGINKQARFQRNCAKFGSPDLAQSDFLSKGGPQRDKMGLDPDGDGYACAWDPSPFRKAVGG